MPFKKFFLGKPKAQKKNTISLKTKLTSWLTSKNKKEQQVNDSRIEDAIVPAQSLIIAHERALEQQLIDDAKMNTILDPDAQMANEKHRWTQMEAEILALKNILNAVQLELVNEKETKEQIQQDLTAENAVLIHTISVLKLDLIDEKINVRCLEEKWAIEKNNQKELETEISVHKNTVSVLKEDLSAEKRIVEFLELNLETERNDFKEFETRIVAINNAMSKELKETKERFETISDYCQELETELRISEDKNYDLKKYISSLKKPLKPSRQPNRPRAFSTLHTIREE
jgi:chromosome segregation ATPase